MTTDLTRSSAQVGGTQVRPGRAICPTCGRDVAINPSGRLRSHRNPSLSHCPGRARWEKLPPLDGGASSGCLNCGPRPHGLDLDTVLAVGFGCVQVTKGDEGIWSGDDENETLRRFEVMATADPDHDWRVEFIGPLSEATYQRHGRGEWVLVARGRGFA